MSDEPAMLRAAGSLVDHGLRACDAYGRPDLAAVLQRARERLADPSVHVVVVGEFKQGKSCLVNGLVGVTACPVDDDIATGIPTYLRYGDEPSAALLYREAAPGEAGGFAVRREPIGLDRVGAAILETDRTRALTPEAAGAERVAGAEIRLPRPALEGGLVLVDTPGVGGLGSAHATAALAAAATANAIVFVTDASQELTRAELEFLRQASEMCETVICALTKADIYPAWQQIRALTEGHLRAAGIDAEVVAVASPLRSMAVRANDAALDAESGYPRLLQALAERVGGDAIRTVARGAMADVVRICAQLEAQFSAERAALADPESAARVVAELTAVQQQVQTLKSSAARWSRTLSDGIADLNADIDHDLRRRIRDVIDEATDAIDEADPIDIWEEMEVWLQARVAHEMLANFGQLRTRATELSELVGEHFRDASGEVLAKIGVVDPTPHVDGEAIDHKIELDRMGFRKQAFTLMRAAYSGTIMFVMLGSLMGVTLGPIAIGIALVMGHRGLKEEKKRQREARQRQAVAAMRQYVDQVGFVVGKDSRDALRAIQRQLRDHYTDLAEQLDRSNNEALRAAQEAVTKDGAERKRRAAEVDAELARLRALRERTEHEAAG